MGLLKEFKEFAMKGSVIDLAVGVIIGAAFGMIVKSAVDDLLMPPLGYLMGGADFSDKTLIITKGSTHPLTGNEMPPVVIRYGKFLNVAIAFAIQALAIFALIKVINMAKRPAPTAGPPPLTKDQELLTEIRDLLRKNPQ
jgi:large conductance mechanosensitive channel